MAILFTGNGLLSTHPLYQRGVTPCPKQSQKNTGFALQNTNYRLSESQESINTHC